MSWAYPSSMFMMATHQVVRKPPVAIMHSSYGSVPTHLHPSIIKDSVGDEDLQTLRSKDEKTKCMCLCLHSSEEKPPTLHLIITCAVAVKSTAMTCFAHIICKTVYFHETDKAEIMKVQNEALDKSWNKTDKGKKNNHCSSKPDPRSGWNPIHPCLSEPFPWSVSASCVLSSSSLRKQTSYHFTSTVSPLLVKRWLNWSITL